MEVASTLALLVLLWLALVALSAAPRERDLALGPVQGHRLAQR